MLNLLATIIDVSIAGEIGLVLFVLIFIGVGIWTFTRTKRDVSDWSEIPLSSDRPDQKHKSL